MRFDALEDRLPRRPGLIVGQAPSARSDPRQPLTGGRSGRRLVEAMGLELRDYVGLFARANLLAEYPGPKGVEAGRRKGDAFSHAEACAAAETACVEGSLRGRVVVLVGWNVACAFGARKMDRCVWAEGFAARSYGGALAIGWVPHPSGVNLWWNDTANREAARRFLRAAVDLVREQGTVRRAA